MAALRRRREQTPNGSPVAIDEAAVGIRMARQALARVADALSHAGEAYAAGISSPCRGGCGVTVGEDEHCPVCGAYTSAQPPTIGERECLRITGQLAEVVIQLRLLERDVDGLPSLSVGAVVLEEQSTRGPDR